MPFVLNLKTKELSPMPSGQGVDPKEFISSNALIVTDAQAREIGATPPKQREAIVTAILGKRLLADQSLTAEHRKILEAGLAAIKPTASAAVEAVVEEEPAPTAIELTLDTGAAGSLLPKTKIAKLNQANLVKYARDLLGLEVSDNEPFELLKQRVYAKQFADKA